MSSLLRVAQLVLPALLPSWRFFDRIGPSPRIEYRIAVTKDDPSPWREVHPPPASLSVLAMLGRLVWNPDGNERLFLVSCAERLLESPSVAHAERLVSRVKVAVVGRAAAGLSGELWVRVVLVTRVAGAIEREVAYVSEPQPLESSGASSRP